MEDRLVIYECMKRVAEENLRYYSLDYEDCHHCDLTYNSLCKSFAYYYQEEAMTQAVFFDFRGWEKALALMLRDYSKEFLDNYAFSRDTETYRGVANLLKDKEWLAEIDRHVENGKSRLIVKKANRLYELMTSRDGTYRIFLKKKSDYYHSKGGNLTKEEIEQFDLEEDKILALDKE